MIKNIPCVILAGGKSSRMGEDKSLLPFGGFDTLCEYQYDKFSKIFSQVFISAKTNKFNFIKPKNLILDDNLEVSSPMIALKSILEYINSDKVFIVTVDTPLIKIETIKNLINNHQEYEITIAQDNQKVHNLCGVFSKKLLPQINQYIMDDLHKINFLLENSDTKNIYFEDGDQFINLNTRDEYRKALLKSYL
jgi:molybdopterin-guanine dinucleotide biosynthesis protein A